MKYLGALVLGIMLALAVVVPASADSMERDQIAQEDHAIAFALSNIPYGDNGLTFGAGVGMFEDESALAIGASYGKGPLSFTFNSVTTDDGKNMGAGIGVSWKFGK